MAHAMREARPSVTMHVLWALGFVGLCGVHRLYCGKWLTGCLWLLTLGFLWVGQIIDLALLPDMIDEAGATRP
jgi:TM2 domain-containing membrane protein YozV